MNTQNFLDLLAKAAKPDASENFRQYLEHQLVYLIQTASSGVHDCFFPSVSITDHGLSSDTIESFQELSIRYACYGIWCNPIHGFEKTVQNSSYSSIGSWFEKHHSLGDPIFCAFLDKYSVPLTDSGFQQELIQTVLQESFITGTFVTSTTISHENGRLLLAAIRLFLPEQYPQVLEKWYSVIPQDVMSDLTLQDWFAKYTSIDTLFSSYLKSDITAALNTISNDSNREEIENMNMSGDSPFSSWDVVKHHEYDLGEAVLQWLNGSEPARYNLRSDASPDNHVDEITGTYHENNVPGCVTPHTQISLADGSSRDICLLLPGDRVLNQELSASVCSDEFIHNHSLNVLYGINDMEPFMSPEHAIMTDRGWCSLVPALSNQINSFYQVKLLKIGDKVLSLSTDSTGRPCLSKTVVEKIPVIHAKPGEYFEGWDLHFREGCRSYFANGLLCLLNYPEFTIKRLLDQLNAINPQEKEVFFQLILENRSLFEKVFGTYVIHQFLQEADYAEL